MASKRDVTGVWYGGWSSESPSVAPGNFIATLEEFAGQVEGNITERDPEVAGAIERSIVSGNRKGATLRFVKQYDGGARLAHAVQYAGRINAEGTEITGNWTLPLHQGAFVMRREKFDVEELEDEQQVIIAVPLGGR